MIQQIHQFTCACTPLRGAFTVGSNVHAQTSTKEYSSCQKNTSYFPSDQGRMFGRDKSDTRTLGIIQLMILNRIKADPKHATARKITDDLSKIFGERIPDAQVFVTLSRLRDRGLVNAVRPETNQANTTERIDTKLRPILTALPSKSARNRGRRAATMQLTSEGVRAVEQAALLIRLSASASASQEGDRDVTTTTNAAEAATLG